MLLTGEQKSSHAAKGQQGHFCTKPAVPPIPACHHRQAWPGAHLMPGLCYELQLRVVTSLMQNVTTAP